MIQEVLALLWGLIVIIVIILLFLTGGLLVSIVLAVLGLIPWLGFEFWIIAVCASLLIGLLKSNW